MDPRRWVAETVGAFFLMLVGPGAVTVNAYLGPAVVGRIWRAHWIYWLAPITGMIVAARAYDYLRPVVPPITGAPPLGVQGPINVPPSAHEAAS